MLGKLIKYDLKAEYKKFGILYISLLVVSALTLLTSKMINSYSNVMIFNYILAFFSLAIVLLSLGVVFMTVIFSITRFYKNLLKDEGYLMHTLPVKTSQLILSKLISFLIWIVASIVVLFLAISITSGGFEWITKLIDGILEGCNMINNADFTAFIIYIIVLLVISPIALMSQVYLSFALGQLSNKSKLGMSVLSFIGIYIVQQILSYIVIAITIPSELTFSYDNAEMSNAQGFAMVSDLMIISIILTAVITAVMYISANALLTKKLNLE